MNEITIFTPSKMMFMRYLFPLLMLALLAGACNKEKRQAKKDKKIIEDYVSSHHLNASSTPSGLYYVIDVTGTGAQPSSSSTVTVAYKGYLTNGNVFDQTDAAGATFSLGSVIAGWQEGIPLFKKGGSGKLIIPSKLGYGTRSMSGIPANSVLVFEITLVDVL
jgi:FKBP-type peptidyl-prolyl cis-trans isomerase FkpA